MSKCLIVNADDYGLTRGVSQGIRHAHLHGIVTSTTAMMNKPGVEADLRQALEDCPHLGLGVHLVLTSGAPVLPVEQVWSLTGGGANFPHLADQAERIAALNTQELQQEWRAQIERFITATGRTPDHLDSHHHFSYFSPLIFRSMLELARGYGCAIRMPLYAWDGIDSTGLPPDRFPQINEFIPALMDEFSIRCPDHFTAGFYAQTATRTGMANILTDLPDGMTEIMCHPGFVDSDLLTGSSYNHQRAVELAVLTDETLGMDLRRQGIQQTTFL